jgi:ribonuclease HII
MLKSFHTSESLLEAGIDEAGRGCYAGPVFASAVILPIDFFHPWLNDSKQLTEKKREALRPIIEQEAMAYSVVQVDHDEIDRINILQATYKAMHLCVDALKAKPDLLLIDGNRFKPYSGISHVCVVGGDGLYASIAAASVLAKTYRDAYMQSLHSLHPEYGWDRNKGYGTAAHRAAIAAHGLTEFHRKSFQIQPMQIKLF